MEAKRFQDLDVDTECWAIFAGKVRKGKVRSWNYGAKTLEFGNDRSCSAVLIGYPTEAEAKVALVAECEQKIAKLRKIIEANR